MTFEEFAKHVHPNLESRYEIYKLTFTPEKLIGLGGFKIIAWVNVFFQVYTDKELRFSRSYTTRSAALSGIKQKRTYVDTIPIKVSLHRVTTKRESLKDSYK
jgi:hypothetical protein